MKPRILIVDNSPGQTGAFRSIWRLTRRLSGDCDFIFCVPRGSALTSFLSDQSVPVTELPFLEIRRSFSSLLYFPMLLINSYRLARICRNRGIAILHMNDMYNMTGMWARKFYPKVRLLYHVRLLPDSYIRRLYRTWLKSISRADAMVTVSKISQGHIARATGKTADVIYDVVEMTGRSSVERHDETVRFLYPANYTRGKGHDLAIRAFALARAKQPGLPMTLRMVGDDFGLEVNKSYRSELLKMVEELKLGGVVDVAGFEPDIEKEMIASDAVLNFSESESFSLVCLEALTLGIPLAATNSGGPAELFEHGVSGLLVENRNVEEMSDAIVLLASDNGKRDTLGREGRDYVKKKFNSEEQASKLSALYDRLLR